MRHQATLRALAFKWIGILHRRWVERTPYDESRYLMTLQTRQAPLLKFAASSGLIALYFLQSTSGPELGGGSPIAT
jgi:hypothetical protein